MLITINRENKEARDEIRQNFQAAIGKENKWNLSFEQLRNVQPSNEVEFWRSRTSYSFDAEIWCGQSKHQGNWIDLMMYYYDKGHRAGGGFAVLVPSGSRLEGRKVEYYSWGACDHKYDSKNIGHCNTRYTCTKCGHYYDVDSSD